MANTPRLIATVIAGLVGLVLTAPEARAASLSVNPTQIRLSRQSPSALLTIKNEGTSATRVHVTVHAWDQRLDGQMDLKPTTDIVFFPSMVTLTPGQGRTIRIGTTAAFTATERSYRIFIEELPTPAEEGVQGSAVRMYTRLGIPIFLEPSDAKPLPRLGAAKLGDGELHFRLENSGTSHFVPESVVVKGYGARGEVILNRKLTGWYVLAGGARQFDVSFDSPDCGRLRSLAIEAQVGETVLKEQLATPRGTCRP
jgi:fimbrial chaperone protein